MTLFYNATRTRKDLSDMGAFTKRWVIDQRRRRREKINKLRKRYAAARSESERNALIAKVRQVSPQISTEEFLKPLREASTAK
jgi:hypothetical protein